MSYKKNGKFLNDTKKHSRRKSSRKGGKLLLFLTVLALLLLIVVCIMVVFIAKSRSDAVEEVTGPQSTAAFVTKNESQSTAAESSSATAGPESTEEATESTKTQLPSSTKTPSTKSSSVKAPNTPIYTLPTLPAKVVIELPYQIPGTDLVIQKVASYNGMYLEDSNDTMVSDVAMILLCNTGSQAVEYANITMKYDDKELTFTASGIPSGGKVTVQEANKSSCASGDLVECTADVATLDTLGMAQESVKVEDNGDNSITITNLTDQNIVTIRLFYKYYLADQDAYLGGITYTAKISNLGANDSIVVTPSHYASSGSTIVMVRTYDTDV